MKVAVLGATGNIGRRLVSEALERGHQVTALARRTEALPELGVGVRRADVRQAQELEAAIQGQDALVSAVGPARGEPAGIVVDAARAVAAACMRAEVPRVLIIGGAGSLNVKPGLELLLSEGFPASFREIALAHREALEIWRKVKELDWTVISPPPLIHPGTRSGRYRTGHNDVLFDAEGQSRISMEDFALAAIDELERHAHLHERITFAY
jgi:putative NADH-flavin reductase